MKTKDDAIKTFRNIFDVDEFLERYKIGSALEKLISKIDEGYDDLDAAAFFEKAFYSDEFYDLQRETDAGVEAEEKNDFESLRSRIYDARSSLFVYGPLENWDTEGATESLGRAILEELYPVRFKTLDDFIDYKKLVREYADEGSYWLVGGEVYFLQWN